MYSKSDKPENVCWAGAAMRPRNEQRRKESVAWGLNKVLRNKVPYSDLKRAPPPPPRMMAFMNAKKRSPYSCGGTGLILC